jgi:adenine-specific DNA methylase
MSFPLAKSTQTLGRRGVESNFDTSFTTKLALREKQIQQNYRPVIGIHKWFARRPGSVFRSLLLAEFNPESKLEDSYFQAHKFQGVIADPFMGGGIPVYEANRLGFHVIGADINAMSFWIVRQALQSLNLGEFRKTSEIVADDVAKQIDKFYKTKCVRCDGEAEVKYFLWVKSSNCPRCGTNNRLFPGLLLAENVRHPKNVVVCPACGGLNEFDEVPTPASPQKCGHCRSTIVMEGNIRGSKAVCKKCGHDFGFRDHRETPLAHEMFAIEYHCKHCKPNWQGRFFKTPDEEDLRKFNLAADALGVSDPEIPADPIPIGDETARLHRWGYRYYRQMFNERQLLGLGLLLRRIRDVENAGHRHALLTVFSDFIRYQNMLCRYDTMALKCQDIFSVHGYPVGLIQCENNVLGIPKVGTGGFRHFIEKYIRAKKYCEHPFETFSKGKKKVVVPIDGETISADLVNNFPKGSERQAWILKSSAENVGLPDSSLDGVFTDPPYFDNVQYAELMDFCYVWLRLALKAEISEFSSETTRTPEELTVNESMGRGIEQFTNGLSRIFAHYAKALKPEAPFVFTYHHNNPEAYVPVAVSLLDARLTCTATLPVVAEMTASLHIARTASSLLDSVFVCRPKNYKGATREAGEAGTEPPGVSKLISSDLSAIQDSGYSPTLGDIRCLTLGHATRLSVLRLGSSWNAQTPIKERIGIVRKTLNGLLNQPEISTLMTRGHELLGVKPQVSAYESSIRTVSE